MKCKNSPSLSTSLTMHLFKDKKYILRVRYKLHGPSIFADKAKIYGVPYNQSSSIAFDETSR